MGGERFRRTSGETQRPVGKRGGLPQQTANAPLPTKDELPRRRFHFNPMKWPQTGGYPPISGGATDNEQPTEEDIEKMWRERDIHFLDTLRKIVEILEATEARPGEKRKIKKLIRSRRRMIAKLEKELGEEPKEC